MKSRGYFTRVKWFCLWMILISSASATPLWASPPSKAEERLRQRVTEFWNAWQKNDADKLSKLVLEEDRAEFSRVPRITIYEFRIASVKMAPDEKSAVVETRIRRQFPMHTTLFDWGLENQWVFSQGDWYLHYYRPASQGELFKGLGGRTFDARDKAKTEIPKAVHFETTQYDFGKISSGSKLQYVFHFKNAGKSPVRVVRVETNCQEPPENGKCAVAHSNGSVFEPGKEGRIEVEWPNTTIAQKVNQSIEVDFDTGEVFTLHFVGEITAALKPK